MAEQAPKTKVGTVATSAKKKAPAYEMVANETGALRRVPVGTVVAPPPPPPRATGFRPSITAAALGASTTAKPAAVINENELVFDESGEEVSGEAKVKALAEAKAKVNEEELVFDESGEELTGEQRTAAQRSAEEKAAPPPAKPAAKPRKAAKNVKVFQEVNDVEKMKLFYRYRAKNPFFFTYTAEGNLEIKPNNPPMFPATTIPLRAFASLEPEQLEEIETRQREKQGEIETNYVQKMKELRAAHDAYTPQVPESRATLVRLNEELRELSVLRNKTLYPERWTKELENPTTKDIIFTKPHEERKLGYAAFLFKRYPLSRNDAEGHYTVHGAMRAEGMEGGAVVVLFLTNPDDQKTGQFHPAAEREFVYNETKYASPYQAYETERFKELEDEKMVKQLLGTRSAKTIRQLVSKEPKQPQFPVKLWEEILESFYSQFKDAADKLKGTGSARFHMMDKQTASPDYAVALANVRTKLKERENDAPANVDAIKQSVITEEEQKKAKVGAIIHNFRRGM